MMAPKLEVLKKLLDDPASGICEPISAHSLPPIHSRRRVSHMIMTGATG